MKSEYLGFLLTLRFTLTLGAGDHPYEWGGIFETPESNYMWTAQKVNQNYADPSLTMVAWPVTTFTKEALHALEEQAEDAMNMTCTDVQAGGTIVPASNTCFRLVFQQILVMNVFLGYSLLLHIIIFIFAQGETAFLAGVWHSAQDCVTVPLQHRRQLGSRHCLLHQPRAHRV